MLNNKMKLNIQLFATTLCTIAQTSGPSHDRARIQVVVSEELISAENKSKITAKVQLKKTNDTTTACTFNATISIDGQSGTCSKYKSNWNNDSWQDIGSVTKTVEHNQDGSKTIAINTTVKTEDDATSLTGTYKANKSNVVLTGINRASALNAIDDFQLNNTTHVTINRYIDSAKHTLAVKSGSTPIKTYTEPENVNWASSGIDVSFSPTEKTTIQNLMTSPQIELTFILTTKNSGTTIGSSTQKAMVSSLSKPIYRNIIKKQNGHYQVAINGVVNTLFPGAVQRYNDDGSIASDWELLYAPSSATSGTFQLSETAANFKFLIFIYECHSTGNIGGIRSTIVYNPDGKKVELSGNYDDKPNSSSTENFLYICNAKYTISGTTVTKNQEIRWRLTPSDSSQKNTRTTGTANLEIYAVFGIRGYVNNL